MSENRHLTMTELEAGLEHIRQSPKDNGRVELIVRRPASNEREVLTEGTFDQVDGLVGDNWKARGSSRTSDGSAHPDMQINIMNARAIALIAVEPERRKWAGDQLYLDFDLSEDNLPPGTQLEIGSSILEITSEPHNGCKKFTQRFGLDAVKFVNSEQGKQLHLRGVNAKVVQSGTIQNGDIVKKR